MKRAHLTLAFFLVFSLAAFAQKGDPVKRAEKVAERMKADLSLNEKQYEQVKEILVGDAEAWKADETKSLTAKKERRKDRQEKFREIMTEEQWATWKAKRKEYAEERKERRGKK